MKDCEWNKALLDGVARTFTKAVLRFQDNEAIKFQWSRYLPCVNIRDNFWKNLRSRILHFLSLQKCLLSSSGQACFPKTLRILDKDYLNSMGLPLLNDSEKDDIVYLSRHYPEDVLEDLYATGVQKLSHSEFLTLAEAGKLTKASDGKEYVTWGTFDDLSHEKLSGLLLKCLELGDQEKMRVHNLPLIPITNANQEVNGWSGKIGGPVYYPLCDGKLPLIPKDLGIFLLRVAEPLPNRKSLFKQLGVVNADPQPVISVIKSKYPFFTGEKVHNIKIINSLAHLQFIFYHLPSDNMVPGELIYLLDQNETIIERYGKFGSSVLVPIYFNNPGDEHGATKIFQAVAGPHSPAPAYEAHFLHPLYTLNPLPDRIDNRVSWLGWLQTYMGVLTHPRLFEKNLFTKASNLSPESIYLMTYKPAQFLALLKQDWESYMSSASEFEGDLRQSKIKVQNGSLCPFSETMLPDAFLQATVITLGGKLTDFPFLPIQKKAEGFTDWKFLNRFGVCVEPDLKFYLRILDNIHRQYEPTRATPNAHQVVIDVYSEINNLIQHKPSTEQDKILK